MKIPRFFLFSAVTLMAASSLQAATGSWNVNASGDWSLGTNWLSNTIADGETSIANFTNDITVSRIVTLDSSRSIGGLTFDDAGASSDSNWTLASSGGSILTLDNTAGAGQGTATITVTNTATISAQLAGGNLSKAGGGNLVLSGNNSSYTGNININGATLTVSNSNALGSGTTTLGSSATGASIVFQNLNAAFSTNGLFKVAQTGSTGGFRFITNNDANHTVSFLNSGQTMTGVRASTLSFNGSNTGDNTFAQAIGDLGALQTSVAKSGAGKWILSGANTYTGTTSVSGGKLVVNNNSALGGGNVNVSTNLSTLQVGDGTGSTVNNLTLGLNATLTLAADSTLKLGGSDSQIDMNGGIFSFGDGVNIDITGLGLGVGSYILVDGTVGGSTIGSWDYTTDLIGGTGGFTYTFGLAGNDAVLTVVPEPSAALLGGLGALALLRRRRSH